jgi:hypothetical protein
MKGQFKYGFGPRTKEDMILFDYVRDVYDYLEPYFTSIGSLLIGLSLGLLIFYTWYLHGSNSIITDTLGLVLVVGGVMYASGSRA